MKPNAIIGKMISIGASNTKARMQAKQTTKRTVQAKLFWFVTAVMFRKKAFIAPSER
jgi:hypothetical protein